MSIESTHPQYAMRVPDWEQMRDTYGGERVVKSRRWKYLPATAGMIEDGVYEGKEPGKSAYDAYLMRAVFPDFVKDAVNVLVGVMHRKPARIELPAALRPMLERATRDGQSLHALLRKINEEQLLTGRFGLLADAPARGTIPHLVSYEAESIINWDDELVDGPEGEFLERRLNFLVLREDVVVRGAAGAEIYDWQPQRRFRVLQLMNDAQRRERGIEVADADPESLIYSTWVEYDEVQSPVIVPRLGGRALNELPFVVIGANDLCLKPDDIPLLGLSNISLTVYRGEADLRQSLFMLGQDTLVVIGEEIGEDGEPTERSTRLGAGGKISVPHGGDAKMIGANGDGLPEQRRVLADDYNRAREAGSRLLEPRAGQAESGEALKVRVAAQTASLHQIALTAAAGLKAILQSCARWVGADPEEVVVEPNLDFSEANERPASLRDLMDAKSKGAPISLRSVHEWAQDNGLTKRTFEEEMEEIRREAAEVEAMRISRETAGAKGATPAAEVDQDEDSVEDGTGEPDEELTPEQRDARRQRRERRRTGRASE